MPSLYGIDGCPAGWLAVRQTADGPVSARIHKTLDEFAGALGPADAVAIDMPIGLATENTTDHARRACDLAARAALRPRSYCVFFAPARGILPYSSSHSRATRWHKRHTGKGISVQAFHILPKIAELDSWLRRSPGIARRVSEVHPELSFAHWNREGHAPAPLLSGKKTPEGATARRRLIERQWPGAIRQAITDLGPKSANGRRRWDLDDLHDAFAAVWTAGRIASRTAISYPDTSPFPKDAYGLSLGIRA